MQRRDFLGGLAAQLATRDLPVEQPNVIWLLAGQHRAQSIAANGDPNVRTPNLDRMSVGGRQL